MCVDMCVYVCVHVHLYVQVFNGQKSRMDAFPSFLSALLFETGFFSLYQELIG